MQEEDQRYQQEAAYQQEGADQQVRVIDAHNIDE
jgi:hypothetical protein